MPKKKKQNKPKKTMKNKVSQKKIVKKKPAKKITVKKKPAAKKKAVQKKNTKKPVNKKSAKKQPIKKIKTAGKIKAPILKKHPASGKQKTTEQFKAKNSTPNLVYREKELKKLLDKEKEEKMILKDMKGRTYCAVDNCDYPAIMEDHCRIHFFGLFKMIKKKKQILEQDLLTKNYQSLINKHSPVVFDHLFKDLSSDKSFKLAMKKFTDEEIDDLETEDAVLD